MINTYCFEDDKGNVVEKDLDNGKEIPERITVKGKKYNRSYRAEAVGIPASAGWPMECIASGVHADQGRELGEFLNKNGVPTDISRDGNPIYRDVGHRRKALKARNFVDKDSFI